MAKLYHVQEFAEVAGVTVRTLHHYDRLALLEPQRTQSGYRLYSLSHLERLEQIAALKLLGLPLRQIKGILDKDTRGLPDVLSAQRRALEERRRQLDRVIRAIADLERTVAAGESPDAGMLKRLIEVIEMQDNAEHMKQYYSDEAWAEMSRRRENMTPEMRAAAERASQAWLDLYRDIRASLDEDPASEKAQALLARWSQLVESFTGGSNEIKDGLRKAWSDRSNWPNQLQQLSEPFDDPRVWTFIGRVSKAARRQDADGHS